MPPVTLDDIQKTVGEINGSVKTTEEKIVSFGNDLSTLKAFEGNATQALDALRAELKAMHTQVFDSQGNYRGVCGSRKMAELAGHWLNFKNGSANANTSRHRNASWMSSDNKCRKCCQIDRGCFSSNICRQKMMVETGTLRSRIFRM